VMTTVSGMIVSYSREADCGHTGPC
jgi:hypothetical protein